MTTEACILAAASAACAELFKLWIRKATRVEEEPDCFGGEGGDGTGGEAVVLVELAVADCFSLRLSP